LALRATLSAGEAVLGLLVSEHTFWADTDLESFKILGGLTSLVARSNTLTVSVGPTFGASTRARSRAWLADTSELLELSDIGIEWLSIGEILKVGIFVGEFFSSDGVLLGGFAIGTTGHDLSVLGLSSKHPANSSLLGFHISFGNLTLLKVILGLEVILSLLLVFLDFISGIGVTVVSLESIEISLGKVLHGNSSVEGWASLDAHDLSRGVGVLGVLKEIVLLVAHQARRTILALEATLGALSTGSGGGSGETFLALHAFSGGVVLASMAVLVRAGLAFLTAGSIVLDTLNIDGIDLNLTWGASSSRDTGVILELESFLATLALIGSGSRASLARSVTLGTGLGLDFKNISIVILNLSGSGGFNLVLTESTSGAFTFVHTALLTVRLTFVANVELLVVEESGILLVGWALLEAHTDQLSDLLGLSFNLSSGFLVGSTLDFTSTLLVPDFIHGLIVSHISGLLVRLLDGFSVELSEIGFLGSGHSLLDGEDSSSFLTLHGFDHIEVHVDKIFTCRWLIDHIEHFSGVFVGDSHLLLVGSEDSFTSAGEAAGLGSVNTFSAGEVALLARSVFGVGVHAWGTDLTLGLGGTDSAAGD
jgi:hypothetical protein